MKRSKDYKEQKTLLKVIELEGFIKEESYRNTGTNSRPITKTRPDTKAKTRADNRPDYR